MFVLLEILQPQERNKKEIQKENHPNKRPHGLFRYRISETHYLENTEENLLLLKTTLAF